MTIQILNELLDKISHNKISSLTILISISSFILALQSKRIAKRALSIEINSYNDKQSNFDVYLIDGFRSNSDGDKPNIILLNITINNMSDSKNTFKCILEIEYLKPNNKITKVLVPHTPYILSDLPKSDIYAFDSEIRLEEKYSESKWLLFLEPVNPFTEYRINKYVLKVSDNKNKTQIIETYILRNFNAISGKTSKKSSI